MWKELGHRPRSKSTGRGMKHIIDTKKKLSGTALLPTIFRSSVNTLNVYHVLLQPCHDVSNVTFHISACVLKCQDAYTSGSTESSSCTPPAPRWPVCTLWKPSGKTLYITLNFTNTGFLQPLEHSHNILQTRNRVATTTWNVVILKDCQLFIVIRVKLMEIFKYQEAKVVKNMFLTSDVQEDKNIWTFLTHEV